jgi:hypothetical protein
VDDAARDRHPKAGARRVQDCIVANKSERIVLAGPQIEGDNGAERYGW